MKQYSVTCHCGQTYQIFGADAGRKLPCRCGKSIDIPLLSELRRSAGEATIAPELEITMKLQEKLLPEDSSCLKCGHATSKQAKIPIVCETISFGKNQQNWFTWLMLFLIFGWLSFLIMKLLHQDNREYGRDINFALPIRICESCFEANQNQDSKSILEKVPLYDRLLKKFPNSKVKKMTSHT